MLQSALLLLVSFFFTFTVSAARSIVEAPAGAYEGVKENGNLIFKGIPYAKPPVGPLRWMPPRPPIKHEGVYLANKFGEPSLQPTVRSLFGGETKIIGSEDCLYLNIWAPVQSKNQKLPVMFWIHGGGYFIGSGNHGTERINMYDGAKLAQQGKVIVVSINYRLGPMGFMAHKKLLKESKTTGNYGTLDMIHALKWVKKNISAFGGDSSAVTIFGESAGGAAVRTLIASPKAKGLFSRAIVQSGPDFNFSLKESLKTGQYISKYYGLSQKRNELSALRKVPGVDIVRDFPMDLAGVEGGAHIKYGPVIDGSVLKHPVLETISKGEHSKVPVIIGSNAKEMTLLAPVFLKNFSNDLSDKELESFIVNMFDLSKYKTQKIVSFYSKDRYGSNKKALIAMMGDGLFQAPTQQFAKAMESQNPGSVYSYLFAHNDIKIFKSGHALELPYLFGNEKLLLPLRWPIFFPALGPLVVRSEARFSRLMMRYWTSFAHNANPNGNTNSKRPFWPKFRNSKILELKPNPSVLNEFRAKPMAFWDKLTAKTTTKPKNRRTLKSLCTSVFAH